MTFDEGDVTLHHKGKRMIIMAGVSIMDVNDLFLFLEINSLIMHDIKSSLVFAQNPA